MSLPQVTVEFGFGQSIGTAKGSVTWTDVTSYVRAGGGVTFDRGRSVVGQAPAAGTFSVTLANDDGRFTPGRTSGPYGAGVRPRIPVRVRATVDTDGDGDFSDEFDPFAFGGAGATTYDLWYGFVTDIDWLPGGEVRARIQASDILAQAAKTSLRPWVTGRTLSTGPVGYWPLTDGAGAVEAASGLDLSRDDAITPSLAITEPLKQQTIGSGSGASLAFGVVSDVAPDGDEASFVAAFTPSSTSCRTLTANYPGSNAGLSVGVWVRLSDLSVDRLLWAFGDHGNGGATFIAVGVKSDGRILTYSGDPVFRTTWRTVEWGNAGTVKVGQWHHITVGIEFADVGVIGWDDFAQVIVDGTSPARGLTSAASGSGGGFFTGTVYPASDKSYPLNFGGVPGMSPANGLNGQLAHIVVGLSPDPYPSDTPRWEDRGGDAPDSATRFTRLASCSPRPVAVGSWLSADATGDAVLSPQPTAKRTLLEVAQDVATVERGNVIATRDGFMRLQSSRSRLTETIALTLDARADVLSLDGAFGVDDADAVDEVTVTRQPTGDTYTGKRAGGASLESTALEAWTPDTVHAQAIADGIANYPADLPKAPALSLSMSWAAKAGLAGDVLDLELGDLIRVTNLPAGSAPATTVDLVVESIAHSIDVGDWTVSITTSPGPLAAGAVVGTSGALSTVASTLTIRP